MWEDIVFVLWFFLPAGVANVVPILVAKMPVLKDWNYPLDFNMRFRERRVLGDHKTWRGLICGVLVGGFFGGLIGYLRGIIGGEGADFVVLGSIVGLLQSVGALLGDVFKSFLKRQLSIPSGKSWYIFDQIDYILGAVIFIAWYLPITLQQMTIAIMVWGLISLISSYLGYLTKFKSTPI